MATENVFFLLSAAADYLLSIRREDHTELASASILIHDSALQARIVVALSD
jgi:hypothetical protein